MEDSLLSSSTSEVNRNTLNQVYTHKVYSIQYNQTYYIYNSKNGCVMYVSFPNEVGLLQRKNLGSQSQLMQPHYTPNRSTWHILICTHRHLFST